MTKKISFDQIKPGGFFRIKGRALYQKVSHRNAGQQVSGREIGYYLPRPGPLVTPVNASIVEEK